MRPGSRRSPFLSHRADRDRMPVALLSGFLGSGKTTLVNALLRDPRLAETAVAVNEFGEVPLDRDLIDHGSDRTVVLANGCLCCNLAGDMEDAMLRLFSRRDAGQLPRFKRLIVEPSGLADPAPLMQAILRNPSLAPALRLETIVTTVDAVFAEAQLERHPETRKQVALADRLVLTKTDLADAATSTRVRDAVRRCNPMAPIETACNGEVDAAALFPPGFFDPDDVGASPRPALWADPADPIDPTHAARFTAVSLVVDAPLHWSAFDAWLRTLRLGHAAQLLRVKAMLNVADVDGPVVVHGVHHVLHAPVALDRWPTAERQSRIVLIADDTLAGVIRTSWADALPGMLARPEP